MKRTRIPPEVRFWNHVEKTPSCWIWTGYILPNGYGQFRPGTRSSDPHVYAHRYAYELANGPIPPGAFVLHWCNVPFCVRPSHLYLGDYILNAQDMVIAGHSLTGSKHSGGRPSRPPKEPKPPDWLRGERHPKTTLTDEDVRAMRVGRAAGASYAALAKQYGVYKATSRRICLGLTWGHIE